MAAPCGHELVAFDHFGPNMLEITFGRLFRDRLVSDRGCLSSILIRVPRPVVVLEWVRPAQAVLEKYRVLTLS